MAWAADHDGRYVRHLDGGQEFLAQWHALGHGMRPVILCGHEHWHHVIETPLAIQCATAALLEYPMEARLVTLTPSAVKIETLPTAVPEIAITSLDGTTFSAGRPDDRTVTLAISTPETTTILGDLDQILWPPPQELIEARDVAHHFPQTTCQYFACRPSPTRKPPESYLRR